MSYVLIYGGMRLELDESVMRELNLRPGQHIENDKVDECMKAMARALFESGAILDIDPTTAQLAKWAGYEGTAQEDDQV